MSVTISCVGLSVVCLHAPWVRYHWVRGYLDMPGFFGRDGGPADEVGVWREDDVGVTDLGSRDVDGDARAAVGVVTVRVCATCVWYVTVVVVRPPADLVSTRDVVWTSIVGDCGPTSLNSETSELTDARLLGRLLPWLGAGLPATTHTYIQHYHTTHNSLLLETDCHTPQRLITTRDRPQGPHQRWKLSQPSSDNRSTACIILNRRPTSENTSWGVLYIRGNTVICVKYSEWWNAYAKNVDGF